MLRNSLSWYIFTLTLFELIIKTHLTLHDSSHGFISKNPRYFDDDLTNIHEEITSLRTSRINDVPTKLQLKFEPSFLDFKQRPLGVPHLEKVTLFNIDKNKSIDMTSISGSTVHFHSSFFEDKRIPPNGNTSFNVVFLGREEGFVESSLFIHTSEGFLKYNVKGASTFSHYRLRPLVGIKLPLNSSFSPLIYMHNPHSEPIQDKPKNCFRNETFFFMKILCTYMHDRHHYKNCCNHLWEPQDMKICRNLQQIVEIYSSGGDFHLELPSGEQEGPNDMWEIPPQHTKAVIRVRFQAKVVQNHTAYVRIKLNKPDEILVVPLEVEVTSVMGIFHPQGAVDFGIGGSLDTPKEVKLCLYNPHKKHVRIHSVSTTSKAIKAHYYNIRLQPESEVEDTNNKCNKVGTLTVDWRTAFDTKDYSGKIIVKYRNGKNRSEIPYHITVLKGGISYDPLTTTYFINDRAVDLSSRAFKVKNEFDYHLKISNITFPQDAHLYFKVETLIPKVLKPGQEANIFNIKLKSNIRLSDLQLHSHILLKTNISTIMVPLLSYNGKLQVHLPFKSKDYSLDIGLISFDMKREVYFMIVNHNPVTLYLKNIHSSIPMTSIEVHGCGTGDYRLVLFQVSFSNLTKCHNLKSNHYAILKLVISTAHVEGQVWGDIYIETQFENLNIPVHFKIAPGKLEIGPDRLVFDQCFPAKICSHPLRVHSTYNDPMIIEDIITLPPDKRISSRHTGHILARTSKVIGHLFLNPDLECQADCYTGLQTDTSAQWLKTFSLSKFVSEFDLHLVNVFYNRYLNLTSNGMKKWQNLTLRLDTSEVRGHIFKTRVKMSWPSLLAEQNLENRSLYIFPLTQVGNYSYQNITIRNPASYSIVVQLVLDRDYPNLQLLYNGLPSNLMFKNMQDYTGLHGFFFDNETRQKQLDIFWDVLGIKVNRNTVPILLLPGQSQSVLIGFHTQDPSIQSALLLLRNNLTILEVVRLKAQGAFPLFKFGNRKPGSLQPLSFDMTDKHLRDCERQKQYSSTQPNLTVKRTFTARNIGDVTIYVNSFHINDFLCEGYGFKVIDCEPFILPPNGTRKIDIAFTPDLTLTKITRTLILGTSLNIPVNYTLYTTIPATYLNLCAELIMRPTWEIYLSYLTITFMLLLFIVIVFIAVLDAERIKKQAMGSFISPSSPSVQPVLDLRLVGQQTREEIQSTKAEVVVDEEKDDREDTFDDKTLPKELVEEVKPKLETERYTVLIPATGKTKKKLAKKNSGEPSLENIDIQVQEKLDKKREKVCEIKQKIREKREEREITKSDEKDKKHVQNLVQKDKEVKKPLFHSKKHTKNTIVPAYEEETSSTTTDSSCSNNEDPEKENNQRNTKVCSKLKLTVNKNDSLKTPIEENPNHMPEKHVSFNHNNHSKIKHQKSAPKTTKTNDKQNKDYELHHKTNDHHSHNKHHGHLRSTKKREKASKDRKDKNIYHKKGGDKNKHGERQSKISESESIEKRKSPSSFFIPLPTPTTTASVWGESRAKFSDVVARSENAVASSSSSRPLTHTKKQTNNKPTMYVEPYKQSSPVELGPIGSRRTDRRSSNDSNRRSLNDDNHRLLDENFRSLNDNNSRSLNDINHHSPDDNNYMHANNLLRETNNSFFSNSDEIRLEGSSREGSYLEEFASISGGWNHQQNLPNLIESNIAPETSNNSMEDPWNQSLLNSSSYWNSYNPLLNETPLINNTPLLNEAASSQPSTSSTQSAGYLWGSSSVWQPWAPETPRTPTRTPPGFDEFLQRKRDEQPQPSRESYSPFNTSNIWTQQQSNSWNYSQGQ